MRFSPQCIFDLCQDANSIPVQHKLHMCNDKIQFKNHEESNWQTRASWWWTGKMREKLLLTYTLDVKRYLINFVKWQRFNCASKPSNSSCLFVCWLILILG